MNGKYFLIFATLVITSNGSALAATADSQTLYDVTQAVRAAIEASNVLGGTGDGGINELAGQRIAYTASVDQHEQDTDLFLTGISNPGVAQKLTDLPGKVKVFRFTEDKEKIIFTRDLEPGLFMIRLSEPGNIIQLTDEEDIVSFQPSHNSEQVLFRAGQLPAGRLFIVDINRPGETTLVSDQEREFGLYIMQYSFSPEGTSVFYTARVGLSGFDIYVVDLKSPGVAKRVNPPAGSGSSFGAPSLTRFTLSNDGTKVVYTALLEGDPDQQLYVTDLANLGIARRLNGDTVSGVDTFFMGYEHDRIVYTGSDGRGLFAIDNLDPATERSLTPPLVEGGHIEGFLPSPGGGKVAYLADQDVDEVFELYLVDIGTSRVSHKLSDALVAGGDVAVFEWLPDGAAVIYGADQDTDQTLELYMVDVANPGASVRVNAPLVLGGDIDSASIVYSQGRAGVVTVPPLQISADRNHLLYRADQDLDDVFELYLVDLAAPGRASKANESLDLENDVLLYSFDSVPTLRADGVPDLFRRSVF